MSTSEMNGALYDVKNIVNEYGTTIKIHKVLPSQIEYDDYGGIKKKAGKGTIISIKSFPIEYNPSEKRLEKLGIRERVDVVFYISKKDWSDKGYTYKDLYSTQMQVEIDNEKFETKQVNRFSQFGNEWLYYVVGCIRI